MGVTDMIGNKEVLRLIKIVRILLSSNYSF